MTSWSTAAEKYSRTPVSEYSQGLPEDVMILSSGSPALGLMPLAVFQDAVNHVLDQKKFLAFQYGSSRGHPELITHIASEHGVSDNEVMITSGSQQSLDLIAKIFLDPGDSVAVENPTYTGALDIFSWARANIMAAQDVAEVPPGDHKLIYVEPSFQNPTGRCWSAEQRSRFLSAVDSTDAYVIEDAAYADISFGEEPVALRRQRPDRVIYLGSLSKIFNPGLRLAYIVAPPTVIEKLNQAKNITDMATSYFLQEVAVRVLNDNRISEHVSKLRKSYLNKRNLLVAALNQYCPELEFDIPLGGFFLWASSPMPSARLRDLALTQKVSVSPGYSFYATNPDLFTMRLSYARIMDQETASVAAQRLAKAILIGRS